MIRSLQAITAIVLILLFVIIVGVVGYVRVQEGRGGWNEAFYAQLIVMNVYVSFLMPLICLCFGTQALGGDWEERSLIWLLVRPIPRPLIYLAKFLAALFWALLMTLGGLYMAGLATGVRHYDLNWNERVLPSAIIGGNLSTAKLAWEEATKRPPNPITTRPGVEVFKALWPAIALGTTSYIALFHLLGCWFKRSTVTGMVYAFVFEMLFGNLPGMVKRVSFAFYTKCSAIDLAAARPWDSMDGTLGIAPEKATLFLPISGASANLVMLVASLLLLLWGMWKFSRKEYDLN